MSQSLHTDRTGPGSDRTAYPDSADLAAILIAAFGLFLIFGAGIARPETLHNAAHDARHAFAFPCH